MHACIYAYTYTHDETLARGRTSVDVGVEGEGGEEVQMVQESGAGTEVVVGLLMFFGGLLMRVGLY